MPLRMERVIGRHFAEIGTRPDGLLEYTCYLPDGTDLSHEDLEALAIEVTLQPAVVYFCNLKQAARVATLISRAGASVAYLADDGSERFIEAAA